MRQETQLQLALTLEGTGEAQSDLGGGTETQSSSDRPAALAYALMEQVVSGKNMQRALKKVLANKGSPGIDGMTVKELEPHLRQA